MTISSEDALYFVLYLTLQYILYACAVVIVTVYGIHCNDDAVL